MSSTRRLAASVAAVALLVAGCASASPSANPLGSTTTPAYFDVSWADHYANLQQPFDITAPSVAVDYLATGTCSIGFRLVPVSGSGTSVATPTDSVSSSQIYFSVSSPGTGTWQLQVTPGRYHLEGGADGCDWSVTIRPA